MVRKLSKATMNSLCHPSGDVEEEAHGGGQLRVGDPKQPNDAGTIDDYCSVTSF
jgi:hypothetical protein